MKGQYSSYNDMFGSWYCGKSVAYDFCADWVNDYCGGDYGNSGAGTARSGTIGNNNTLSTLKLYSYDPAVKPAVTLFDDPDCKGKMGRFYAPENFGTANEYLRDEMWEHNAGWDRMDSILIPYGVSVDLFDGATFDGAFKTMSG